MVSLRRYIAFAVVIGLIVLAVGLLTGTSIAAWLTGVRDQAINQNIGFIANLIADPLIWVMSNPVIGALLAGLAWPALLIWMALVFVLVLLGFGADAARDLDASVRLFTS